MALSAKILNSEATLNAWTETGSVNFIAGEEIRVKFKIWQPDLDIRYVPPSTTVASFFFQKSDGTSLEKVAALDPDDRSIATVDLEEAETEVIIGGSVSFDLDVNGDASKIVKGVAKNVMRLTSVEGCCV